MMRVGKSNREGIKEGIRDKVVGILSALLAIVIVGCGTSDKAAEQSGQADVMAPAPITAVREEADLQTEQHCNADREACDAAEGLNETTAGESEDSVCETENAPHSEKSQPPADWEFKLDSEDWGLSFGESGMQPVGNASAGDLAWYDAYYVGDDSEKVIYLTFDCGYENGNTEPILDALKKHNVQATFFVVGHFLETAPDMVKRMVEEGHTVGNHTYHHLDMSSISDQGTFQSEMDDVANLFREITGEELSMYYRPPQGKCNEQNLQMAQELGYNTIFWSLAYVDWNQDDQPTHEEALGKLTTRIHPGAVVLMHNTSQTNGEVLDELLTEWEDMGYSFRPLSELTGK